MPDGGRIVNVGSGAPGLAAYLASKGGLTTMTRNLAKELKERGITVNAVLPTVLDTPSNRREMPDVDPSSLLLPEEVAEVILFLVSEKGSIVTGNLLALEK